MSTIEETTATISPCGALPSNTNGTPSIKAEIFRVKVDKLMALLEAEKRLMKEPFGSLEELAKHAEDGYWEIACAKTDYDLAYETDMAAEQVKQIRKAFDIRDSDYRNTQILSVACTYVADLAKKHVDLTKKYEAVCEDFRCRAIIDNNKLGALEKKSANLDGDLEVCRKRIAYLEREREHYQNKLEDADKTLDSCIWAGLPIAAGVGAAIAVALMHFFG